MPLTRYFHGTSAELTPGQILVPGAVISHGVHRHCESVYAAVADEHISIESALELAYEFGGYAADHCCELAEHSNVIAVDPADKEPWFEHAGAFPYLSDLPECVRLYEVLPLGEVQPDPSEDFATGASVRMAQARILHRVDDQGRARS